MIFYIDRIDGDTAVLQNENGENVVLDAALIPNGCKESDILEYSDGVYYLRTDRTGERKREMSDLLGKLLNKKK